MTDETKAFRNRLEELTREAKENGNRISVQQVREKLKDTGLDETKLQMVCSYLDMMSVEVYDEDMPEAASGAGDEHVRSLEHYLDELADLPQMDEVEELTLFHMAAEGHEEARARLTERYLQTVCDLAGEIEARETGKDPENGLPAGAERLNLEGEFTAEDLVQEGNVGLLMALGKLQHQESLAAYRAVLLNEVTSYLEGVVEAQKSEGKSDQRILNRMNQLADASHDLEQELDRKPSLEELSAYLDLPAEEIRDLLRVGGEKLKADDL